VGVGVWKDLKLHLPWVQGHKAMDNVHRCKNSNLSDRQMGGFFYGRWTCSGRVMVCVD